MRYTLYPESHAAHDAAMRPQHEALLFPDPEHSSREPWPCDLETPSAVAKLRAEARSYGWQVRTQYSRGCMPHAITGRPGVVKHAIALRFGGHRDTTRQAFAIYRGAVVGSDWACDTVWVWGPDLHPYGRCGVTELREWLRLAGEVPPGWFVVVTERREALELAKKKVKCPGAPACERQDDHEHRGNGDVKSVARRKREAGG